MEVIKTRPIIFSTEMARAILGGRKFQTRRIIKDSYNGCLTNGGPHPCPNEPVVMHPGAVVQSPIEGEPDIVIDGDRVHAHFFCSTMDKVAYCPYGKVGDILYVRETFRKYHPVDDYGELDRTQLVIEYAADNPPEIHELSDEGGHAFNKDGSEKFIPWKPSIHMPKAAARIFLKITDISVERLQDISDADAFAEGIQSVVNAGQKDDGTARGAFMALWEKINGTDPEKDIEVIEKLATEALKTT